MKEWKKPILSNLTVAQTEHDGPATLDEWYEEYPEDTPVARGIITGAYPDCKTVWLGRPCLKTSCSRNDKSDMNKCVPHGHCLGYPAS